MDFIIQFITQTYRYLPFFTHLHFPVITPENKHIFLKQYFQFILRRPLACGVDYDRNEVYVYDYHIRGLMLLENWNSSAIEAAINISTTHVGISQEFVKVRYDAEVVGND